jgi:hypothetical protein
MIATTESFSRRLPHAVNLVLLCSKASGRRVFAALLATFTAASVWVLPEISKASTITYNLTLTPTTYNSSTPVGGTGSFTIEGPISPSGTDIFASHAGDSTSGSADLLSLSFMMNDGNTSTVYTFDLSDELFVQPHSYVKFVDGTLSEIISQLYTNTNTSPHINLSGLTYTFVEPDGLQSTSGTILATAVPLPSVIWLFGSGLLGLIRISRRNEAA